MISLQVYRREGSLEDPWVQPGYAHDQATALYVENNYQANGGDGEGAKYSGLNVYVRDSTAAAGLIPCM